MLMEADICLGGIMLSETLDRIHIRDLKINTIIGVRPEERKARQEILLNICLFTDHQFCG